MKTMRELLGPDKLFHLNGSIHWLDPRAAQYFDRFVVQSYNGSVEYQTRTARIYGKLSEQARCTKQIPGYIRRLRGFQTRQCGRNRSLSY